MNVSATELVARVRERYAECGSYADQGRQTSTLVGDGPAGGARKVIEFKTRFRRSGEFYFEYRTRMERADGGCHPFRSRCVIWRTGGRARSWWTVGNETREADLVRLIAGATGVSGGSARDIPALLMPEEIGGGSLDVLRGPREAADGGAGVVDGLRRITTDWGGGGTRDVTIDPGTLLIRRIEFELRAFGSTPERAREMRADLERRHGPLTPELERAIGSPCSQRNVRAYDAAFDVDLPDEEFCFEPGR